MFVPQSVSVEDLALVAAIAAGDQAAEEEFVRKFAVRFEYLAHCSKVPWQDCQDVAQEAMITALDQIRRGLFRGEGQLGHWLARIVCGKTMDYWRSQPDGLSVALDNPDELREFATEMRAPLTDYELVACVHETLKALPAQHHVILVLKRTYGFKLDEISQMLEMPRSQVSFKLYAAEEMFRRFLRDGKPPLKKTAGRPRMSGRNKLQGVSHEQSATHHSPAELYRTGNWPIAHRILLWACGGDRAAIGRSPFAGM